MAVEQSLQRVKVNHLLSLMENVLIWPNTPPSPVQRCTSSLQEARSCCTLSPCTDHGSISTATRGRTQPGATSSP